MSNTHEGRACPVSAGIEYHGERTAFGEPMLRLIVGDEWIGMSSGTAFAFAEQLALAAVELAEGRA